jgi:TRAP-type C4-dicarboxylate transport system permease small subunit
MTEKRRRILEYAAGIVFLALAGTFYWYGWIYAAAQMHVEMKDWLPWAVFGVVVLAASFWMASRMK